MARHTSHIVYIIQSGKNALRLYKGYTTNLEDRLKKHNTGGSKYTKLYLPWKLIYYSSFQNKQKALNFEKYLKSVSGIAFMRKRLINYKKI